MSLTKRKRKSPPGLKAWVAFVKKVQREEKLSYKDAIHRAKVRKDKGEKWMMGGRMALGGASEEALGYMSDMDSTDMDSTDMDSTDMDSTGTSTPITGGRQRRKSMRGGEEALVDDMKVTDMSDMDSTDMGPAMDSTDMGPATTDMGPAMDSTGMDEYMGGRRRRKTMRRRRGRGRGKRRTMRRSKGRSRGRGRSQKGGIVI